MKRALSLVALLVAASGAGLARADSVVFTSAAATYSQPGFDIANVISNRVNGPDTSTGWALNDREKVPETATFGITPIAAATPVTQFTFMMLQVFDVGANVQHLLGDFRFSVTSDGTNYFNLSDVTFTDTQGEPATIGADGSVLVGVDPGTGMPTTPPDTSTYTVTGDTILQSITGIRLDVIPNSDLPNGGSGRQPQNGNFVLTHLDATAVGVTPLPSSALGGLVLLAGMGAVGYRRSRLA